MYEVVSTNQFSKNYKLCIRRSYNIDLLDGLIKSFARTGTVPPKYLPHILSGNMDGYWECHIKGDWLLIRLKNEESKTIHLIRTGTHSDLF